MGTILLGVDAQHYAPEATALARDLCRATGDKIILVHVHEFASDASERCKWIALPRRPTS